MDRRIVIIQGHPDRTGEHFGHALAKAYGEGARAGGHEVRMIPVAELDFPLLRSYDDFYKGEPVDIIRRCQDDIRWADHLVIIYPLWLGTMPALLKGFFEQVFRPGFAMQPDEQGRKWQRLLTGKSARIIVTMGMPALIYRWYFRAHSLKSLERNILRFTGIHPVRESLIGMVEGSPAARQRWLQKCRACGQAGS